MMVSKVTAESKVRSPSLNLETGFNFPDRGLEGLVGNGKMIVTVSPGEFQFRYTPLVESGSFKIIKEGKRFSPKELKTDSFFFPGGVTYSVELDERTSFESSFLSPHDKNMLVLKTEAENKSDENQTLDFMFDFTLNLQESLPTFEKKILSAGNTRIFFNHPFSLTGELSGSKLSVLVPVRLNRKEKKEILVIITEKEEMSFAQKILQSPGHKIIEDVANHYLRSGFTVRTPDEDINRAVPFLKYLLHLGYDWPRTMVADIFRWRDVWSRDLGSGSGPGALGAGMFEAARNSLLYDLERHRKAEPYSYRVSEDTSQGGSAEGLGWISSCVWLDYLYTGDKEFLKSAYEVLKPWVESWIARDYAESGLVIDVTEWMDHSRFFRLPEGIRTLYSNVLFYVLLDSISKMAEVIEPSSVEMYSELSGRVVASIQTKLWNGTGNYFNNYTFWGVQDEKLDSVANSLAVLFGVASTEKIPPILDAIRAKNWRKFGSVNIYPAMKYVGMDNDHNVKCWPWWQAKEAKARFLNKDTEGGMKLLGLNLDTLKHHKFPGLIEEYLYPDDGKIDDFAGHSFITGSGSTLDSIIAGLFGFEILSPGGKIIRIAPNLPENWTEWSATFPLTDGRIECTRNQDKIKCQVTGKSAERLELRLPGGNKKGKIVVNGVDLPVQFDGSLLWMEVPKPSKTKISWGRAEIPIKKVGDMSVSVSIEKSKSVNTDKDWITQPVRSPLIFSEKEFPSANSETADELKNLFNKCGRKAPIIGVESLSNLDAKQNDSVFFTQFVLPAKTADGKETEKIAERYLEEGGTIVLWGAKTFPKGTMGESGSLAEWVSLEELTTLQPIEGEWKFTFSDPLHQKKNDDEEGFKKGFHRSDLTDHDWKTIVTQRAWEKSTGKQFDGYGWYRKPIIFPKKWQGSAVIISLGKIDDNDWTYLNGHLIGKTEGWQEERFYKILQGSSAYESIRWGKENLLAIQVQDSMGGGGLHEGIPMAGFADPQKKVYQHYDMNKKRVSSKSVRGGIVSWGPGKFFNDWATSLGLFGFNADCVGIEFSQDSLLKDLSRLDLPVKNVYTDFGVRAPWEFIPVAYTARKEQWVAGPRSDRYPCMAVVRNKKSGGKFVIVPPEIVSHPIAVEVLRRILK